MIHFENSFRVKNSSRWIGSILASKLKQYDIIIPEIQRCIDMNHVDDITHFQINHFREKQQFHFLGFLNIHYCLATERYYLVDGQHRYASIQKLHSEMGHDMEIVVEYVEVETMDELRQNYKMINQNTILPEFPDDIDGNIPQTVAKTIQQSYSTIWSKSPNTKRPNIYFSHFQEGLAVICSKMEITSSNHLLKLILNYNTNVKGWDRCNYPDFESIQDNMLEKCKKTGFYLGMFKHTSDEYKYRWVTDIIRMETNIDYEHKKKTRAKRTSVYKNVKSDSWDKYTNKQFAVHCICCNYNQITVHNFHAGHIISHANGGSSSIDNIMPLCSSCNLSMSSKNMEDFILQAYPQNMSRFLSKKYRSVGEEDDEDIIITTTTTKEEETKPSSTFANFMFGFVSR